MGLQNTKALFLSIILVVQQPEKSAEMGHKDVVLAAGYHLSHAALPVVSTYTFKGW